jgi:DNA-binding MarR family transcriptional regulator
MARGARRDRELQEYFQGVARARYVMRRVVRIVDELARDAGLEPLEHQALIQVFGVAADAPPVSITELAERLDVPAPVASRLVSELERRGLVERRPAEDDRRITRVVATRAARATLAGIDEQVQARVGAFGRELAEADRAAALRIFAFYVSAPPPGEDH